jgi:uncharacterized protein YigE (DUF2233 family)
MRYRSPRYGGLSRQLALVIAVLLLVACGGRELAPQPQPTRPVATLFPTIAAAARAPASAPAPDSGWLAGSSGIAVRHMRVAAAPGQSPIPLVVVRLDPAAIRLRVGYTPAQPRSLSSWFAAEQPLLAVNGGFFTEHYQSTALVISDGAASGASYDGFGGMLAVAADGGIELRALRDHPYDPGEPLTQALQSFPMLIFPGGTLATLTDDGQRARRTAVALDHSGRLLFIISPTSSFTLRGFAGWLSQSDLDIDVALNLDGGSSTGLYLKAGALDEQIDSWGPLPQVLLVEPR